MWLLWIILYLLVGSLVLYGLGSWPRHWLQEIEDGKIKSAPELRRLPASLVVILMQAVFIGYLTFWPIAVIIVIKDKRNASSSS